MKQNFNLIYEYGVPMKRTVINTTSGAAAALTTKTGKRKEGKRGVKGEFVN